MKQTIEEKVRRYKYHSPNSFLWFIYKIAAKIVGSKYHVNYIYKDDISKCKGPCFLIWNHQSRRDYLFMNSMCKNKKFNIVCGYNEFFRKKFKFPFWVAQVLPKKNFTNDLAGTKAMASTIKHGGCVAFSPEGMSSIYGHNQPIVPGTGKFLKFFKVPVYFMKLEGAYLTSHKVSIGDRVGKINATMSLLFSPDDLKNMTDQEIDDKINLAFRHDDYEWNKIARIKYKTKHQACSHLSDLIYKCPKCGEEFSIESKNDYIKCLKCGNGATLDDYYDFHPFDKDCVIPESPSIWIDNQRRGIIKEIRKDDNYSFSFDCKLGELPKHKYIKDANKSSVDCGFGRMTVDHSGVHFVGKKHDEDFSFDLNYQQVYSLVITNDCTNFSFYVDEVYYEFEPTKPVVGKVLLLVEEMHRLHVNYWKNFPWNDDMYKLD